ncbi:hypothetical protein, partial [Tritonibacter sp. SIMBA_163]|uniref:hypothetical protein n=1 Tax=Tritonibacter sp. SIMBA_163 TaxID=3080868 RepID=UPI0039807FD6
GIGDIKKCIENEFNCDVLFQPLVIDSDEKVIFNLFISDEEDRCKLITKFGDRIQKEKNN